MATTVEELAAKVAALEARLNRMVAALVTDESGPVDKMHGPQAPGAGPGGPEAGVISREPDVEGARAAADEALRRVRLNRGRREAK